MLLVDFTIWRMCVSSCWIWMFLPSIFVATRTVVMMTVRGDFVVTTQRKVPRSVVAVVW
jgi:hypothetical protein